MEHVEKEKQGEERIAMNVEGVHPLHLYREKKGKKRKKLSEGIN